MFIIEHQVTCIACCACRQQHVLPSQQIHIPRCSHVIPERRSSAMKARNTLPERSSFQYDSSRPYCVERSQKHLETGTILYTRTLAKENPTNKQRFSFLQMPFISYSLLKFVNQLYFPPRDETYHKHQLDAHEHINGVKCVTIP